MGYLYLIEEGAAFEAAVRDAAALAISEHAGKMTDAHGGIVATNDGRLSDARPPTAHKSTHAAGGADALSPADIGAVPTTQRGTANGVATLDGSTKIPMGQIPDTVIGALDYQGAWNASTNTPTLDATGTGRSKGDYYVVSVGGATNLAGKTDWEPKDWIVWNGSAWEFVDNTDSVTSVFGRRGPILAQSGDYTAAQVGAAPANDPRLRTIRDEGASLVNRPALDFTGTGVVVTDDGAGNRTQVNISGAAAGLATETAAGIVEIATQAETDAGTDDARFVTPLKLAPHRARAGAARVVANPGFANYSVSLAAGTWTPLSNPVVNVPALPTPPPGTAWRVETVGFLRVGPPFSVTMFVSANVDNGGAGAVQGGASNQGGDVLMGVAAILTPPVGSAFAVNFYLYSSGAGSYLIQSQLINARAFLVAA